jgi:hypothetical protein
MLLRLLMTPLRDNEDRNLGEIHGFCFNFVNKAKSVL